MNQFRLALVGAFAAVVIGLFSAAPAFACDPGRSKTDGTGWNGGRTLDQPAGSWWSYLAVDIEVQDPFVLTADGALSSSYAWVMMTPGSNDHWAQIGPYRMDTTGERICGNAMTARCWTTSSGHPTVWVRRPRTR